MTQRENIESAVLRARRKEATYERVRAKLTSDILMLMRERGLSIDMIAEELHYTTRETRIRVNSLDLRISQLVSLLDALDLEPYVIFRPRRGWVNQ